jgi:hypothetical protein
VGSKRQDYLDFVKVAKLIRTKEHLMPDGLEKIKQIKNGMNKGREIPKALD